MAQQTTGFVPNKPAGKDLTFVAVYGSLRKGMENAHVNKRAGASYVCTTQTVENFDLFEHCGLAYPHVSLEHSKSESPVTVDIYVTNYDGLTGPYDSLEGYPHFYNRTKVAVWTMDGDITEAWLYHIDEDHGDDKRVESGDWVEHKKENGYEPDEE